MSTSRTTQDELFPLPALRGPGWRRRPTAGAAVLPWGQISLEAQKPLEVRTLELETSARHLRWRPLLNIPDWTLPGKTQHALASAAGQSGYFGRTGTSALKRDLRYPTSITGLPLLGRAARASRSAERGEAVALLGYGILSEMQDPPGDTDHFASGQVRGADCTGPTHCPQRLLPSVYAAISNAQPGFRYCTTTPRTQVPPRRSSRGTGRKSLSGVGGGVR